MKYKKHWVLEMDETLMVQHCLICGEVIADYRNVVYYGEKPKGWPAGKVFISEGNPQTFTTIVSINDEIVSCASPIRGESYTLR